MLSCLSDAVVGKQPVQYLYGGAVEPRAPLTLAIIDWIRVLAKQQVQRRADARHGTSSSYTLVGLVQYTMHNEWRSLLANNAAFVALLCH
jgi:hypothetical protein